jgi:hypothetical protein
MFGQKFTIFALFPSIIMGCQPIVTYLVLGQAIDALAEWTMKKSYGDNSFDPMSRVMGDNILFYCCCCWKLNFQIFRFILLD